MSQFQLVPNTTLNEIKRVSHNGKVYALVEDIENPYYLDFRPIEDEKLGDPLVYCDISFCDITGKMNISLYRKDNDWFLSNIRTSSHYVHTSAIYQFELMKMIGKI